MGTIILGLVLLSIGILGLVRPEPFNEPMKLGDYIAFCALLCGIAIFVALAT
jgi:hypothetical protein